MPDHTEAHVFAEGETYTSIGKGVKRRIPMMGTKNNSWLNANLMLFEV
jgi:hypothetical protein